LSASPKTDFLSQNHRLDSPFHPLKKLPLAGKSQVGRARADFVASLDTALCQLNFQIATTANGATFSADIAGMVAAMTECELGAVGETTYTTPLVDLDSPDRSGFGG